MEAACALGDGKNEKAPNVVVEKARGRLTEARAVARAEAGENGGAGSRGEA